MIYIFKDGNMIVMNDAANVDSLKGNLLTAQEAKFVVATHNADLEADREDNQDNEQTVDPNHPTNHSADPNVPVDPNAPNTNL